MLDIKVVLVAIKYKTLLAVLLLCVNKIKGMITLLKWMPFCKSVLDDCKKIRFFFFFLCFDIGACLIYFLTKMKLAC